MIVAMGLPIFSIIAFAYIPQIATINSPKLLLAKRNVLDKQIPAFDNGKLVMYDQKGCGDNLYPNDKKKFFIEEKISNNNDLLIDLIQNSQYNNKCLYSDFPTFYIFDKSTTKLTLINIDEAKKLELDFDSIDKIQGKISTQTNQYDLKKDNNLYKIQNDKVTLYSNFLGRSWKLENMMDFIENDIDNELLNYNGELILQPIGFLK
jgi:hypothetical protein